MVKDSEGRSGRGRSQRRATQITDLWTFARNTRSRDPNWTLVATRSSGLSDPRTGAGFLARRQQPKRLFPFRHLILAGALPLLLATACEKAPPPEAPAPPEPPQPAAILEPSSFEALPGWDADDRSPRRCRPCAAPAGGCCPGRTTRPVGPKALGGRVADWRPLCEDLERLPTATDDDLRRGPASRPGSRPSWSAMPATASGALHRLLRSGAARRHQAQRPLSLAPLHTAPRPGLRSIWGISAPTSKGERIYRPGRQGPQLVPYFERRRDRPGRPGRARAGAALGRRSGRCLLPPRPGLGPGRPCPTARAIGSASPAPTAIPSCHRPGAAPGRQHPDATRPRCRKSATGCAPTRKRPRP